MAKKVAAKPKRTPKAKVAPERAVVVTTAHRGVFFGYTSDGDGETINLRACRLCTYWSRAMRGFMGLASMGPDKDCRIGPPADAQIRNITAVLEVTPEAAAKWEAAPWG